MVDLNPDPERIMRALALVEAEQRGHEAGYRKGLAIASRLNERRERIATAALQGLMTNPNLLLGDAQSRAIYATEFADALITTLDAKTDGVK